MSRETDSSSSGPQGRGGAAYPSGTPPYGSRQYPSLHPSQDAPEEAPESADPSRSEEPRTETTLTTRIRINIPGSRPIPPVVMRTPVGDADSADAERTGSIPRPGSPAADGVPAAFDTASAAEARTDSASAEPAAEKPAREKSGSDWFAPRKPPTNTSVAGGTSGGGTAGGAEGIRDAAPTPPAPPRADLPYFSDGPQRAGDQGAPGPDDFGTGGPASGGPRPTPNLGVRTPAPPDPPRARSPGLRPSRRTWADPADPAARTPWAPAPWAPAPVRWAPVPAVRRARRVPAPPVARRGCPTTPRCSRRSSRPRPPPAPAATSPVTRSPAASPSYRRSAGHRPCSRASPVPAAPMGRPAVPTTRWAPDRPGPAVPPPRRPPPPRVPIRRPRPRRSRAAPSWSSSASVSSRCSVSRTAPGC